jgi:hypothetical protein
MKVIAKGAKIKEKKIEKVNDLSTEFYKASCKEYRVFDILVEKYGAMAVYTKVIDKAKANLDMIKFLNEHSSDDYETEVNALLCLDIYIREIERSLMLLREFKNKRESEIRDERKRRKEEVNGWRNEAKQTVV